MREIREVVIHCSDSPHGRGDDAATIHQWHMEKGWDGIGYHYVITEDGLIQIGRPWYWAGAHVKGHNAYSLGICLIGRDVFAVEQYRALRVLHNQLTQTHPGARWYNHSDLDPGKTCPNSDFVKWLKQAA